MTDSFIRKRRYEILICLFLVAAVLVVYLQGINHDFVNYDDDSYVTENPNVNSGLTIEGIFWAFSTGHGANWHPVTWLSHMIDSDLYGLNPLGHHWTNLQIHMVNSILLFIFLHWITGALWRSSLVAALFAVHPLHVESVAWVSERKDLLCALFWLLSLWAYVRYVRAPKKSRYILLTIFFILGLMSKPMIVTLPFVLLLLDFWPLSRFQTIFHKNGIPTCKIIVRLVREKIPLLVLSAISCLITVLVQQHGGAVASVESIPLKARVANAVVSYTSYIGKMIWPLHLVVLYPYREWTLVQISISLALILGTTTVVILASRKSPYLFTGWFWYLGTLVPVIGLVQVGFQRMADRYTYIPLIGLFIIIAWGLSDILDQWTGKRIVTAVFSSVLVLFFIICSGFQVGYWKNGITLFKHATDLIQDNSIAYFELAHALEKHGKIEESIFYLNRAIRLNPKFGLAHNRLGVVLAHKGNVEAAILHHQEALRINPKNSKAHNNLGNAFARLGDYEGAIEHYQKALRINPGYAGAYYNLGKIFADQNKVEDAIFNYRKAVYLSPNMPQALYHLSWILATCKEKEYRNAEEAVKLADRLCKITRYNQPLALDALAAAYAESKKYDAAVSTAQKALEIASLKEPGELVSGLKDRLQLYKAGEPYRQDVREKNGS